MKFSPQLACTLLCTLVPTFAAATEPVDGATPLQWSQRMAASEMKRSAGKIVAKAGKNKWDYAASLFCHSLLDLSDTTKNAQYADFTQHVFATWVEPNGTMLGYKVSVYSLDSIEPGRTALELLRRTKDARYRKVADALYTQLRDQPRTLENGFWHKLRYPHQMWLDGLFMGEPFYAQYAATFKKTDGFDDIANQFTQITKHTRSWNTGLLYHAWDESKSAMWASPANGRSANYWSRSIGWYAMALVDVLDWLPADHPARKQLITELRQVSAGILKYQDKDTGVWWQVTDQGARPGNYLEASASSMFVYAIAKGVNHGYLPASDAPALRKGYAGLIHQFIRPAKSGGIDLTRCCKVASLDVRPTPKQRDGSFRYYTKGEAIVSNDLKGVGPFILAGIEMQKLP
ncbi:MAG: glycoside hydrolase family 88 protein [Chthoniobacteraceae bacterium]